MSADPLTTTGQFAQFNDLANRADLEAGLRNLERDLKAWAMLALAVRPRSSSPRWWRSSCWRERKA